MRAINGLVTSSGRHDTEARCDGQLPDQDGDNVKLSDLKGQTVVLYFYPKADTTR